MSSIPGLSVCPVEEECGSGEELPTFTGKIFIPESHRYGHCRSLTDLPMIDVNSPIEGQYGVIYKCRDIKTNQMYALKLFKISADLQDGIPSSIIREINILKTLKGHPNIMSSHGTAAGKNLYRNYLVLEYCEVSLKELIEKNIEAIFDRAMVKCILYQILRGLEYIHKALIIHRDICSKNIMFGDGGVLKIGGFRSSRFYNRGNMTPGVSELNYRAPELLLKETEYGPAIDMWSVGCIFAELLLKRPLFSGSSEIELLKCIFSVLGLPCEANWPGITKLLSDMNVEEGAFNEFVHNEMYSELRIFAKETAGCQQLIHKLIVCFPRERSSAEVCLASNYFKEKPEGATSEDLIKVLQVQRQLVVK